MRRRSRDPISTAKLVCALLVISFYLVYVLFHKPATIAPKYPKRARARIQVDKWANETGKADEEKRDAVKKAMHHTFWAYKKKAWGHDEILPVTGAFSDTRNGWGATIIDGSTTLAMMGMWEELALCVDFVIEEVDFKHPEGLVDPFETTIRYLGALVSLIEMSDAKIIPAAVISPVKRKQLLKKTEVLAKLLLPAYDSSTGMPFPRVDFAKKLGIPDPPEVYEKDPSKPRRAHPAIGPARAGSNILENCVLSKLTDNWEYCAKSTLAWMPLVFSRWFVEAPGLVDSPIDIMTGEPVGREKHWDAGHDSYYEYLLKAALLLPHSPNSKTYSKRWIQASEALRHNLSSRAVPSPDHPVSHLYMGKTNGPWFLNEQSHLACFAPGNLLLGGKHLNRKDLIVLGQALLEGCRHSYSATPTGIGPESWSWTPASPYRNGSFTPTSTRQRSEFADYGFWVSNSKYKLRPEYIESLFYAFRVTGELRYREWAWEAFEAMEKHCKTEFGYAGLKDVMVLPKTAGAGGKKEYGWLDVGIESFWHAETLKYFYLIFDDASAGNLDDWVYSTEGHLFRRPS